MPLFDEQRQNLERWVEWLGQGRIVSVRRGIGRELPRLRKVRGSRRHAELVEFLQYASLALETGEAPGGQYILLMAMAAFGWRD